ncbi:MAG: hypothetical protein V3V67_06320 [Myxococcota bacterium]
MAVEHIPVSPGEHTVAIAIGDSADPAEWTYTFEDTLTFGEEARRVVAFDRVSGFSVH